MSHMIDIGDTTKGKRIWIQGLNNKGLCMPRFDVEFIGNSIVVHMGLDNKRKVCAQRGGIIDITSKAVTQWAQDSTCAIVSVGVDTITITRV
jgi:hypothetical protein